MNITEINDRLREMIDGLAERGYKKTDIGKLLLGPNGYSSISKFLRKDEKQMNMGIRPLSRIAEQSGYSVHVCFVKDSDAISSELDARNAQFIQELVPMIENYLNKSYSENMKKTRNSKTRQTLDEILSSIDI